MIDSDVAPRPPINTLLAAPIVRGEGRQVDHDLIGNHRVRDDGAAIIDFALYAIAQGDLLDRTRFGPCWHFNLKLVTEPEGLVNNKADLGDKVPERRLRRNPDDDRGDTDAGKKLNAYALAAKGGINRAATLFG